MSYSIVCRHTVEGLLRSDNRWCRQTTSFIVLVLGYLNNYGLFCFFTLEQGSRGFCLNFWLIVKEPCLMVRLNLVQVCLPNIINGKLLRTFRASQSLPNSVIGGRFCTERRMHWIKKYIDIYLSMSVLNQYLKLSIVSQLKLNITAVLAEQTTTN